MISILHPSRGRPEKSVGVIDKWISMASNPVEIWVSLDSNDPKLSEYKSIYPEPIISNNKSAVDAINAVADKSTSNILIVVSDDTDCFPDWDRALLKAVEGKTDFILKTQDGIQPWIITMPVMDRAYYNRTGYIYHPDFLHMFCDTYMTCVADITGRNITSNLLFKHNHYSVGGSTIDEINKKNDATWKQGEETFIRLMKQFTPEERNRIQDAGMKNWLRNHGIR